ncbi:MAG: ISL3 family transposase [Clostridia bacterium]|nr:ISL3 family transposase [Clostridia bacterium]
MSEFENFEEMFAQSIGLTEPWRIEQAEYMHEERAVHIYVKARKTAKYPCPVCGEMLSRYDNEQERIWQHGDVVFFPCYVHCKRPRVKCPKCEKTHVVTAPWARKGSRYTLLFEAYAMLLAEKLPLEQARRFLRISHTSLTNIVAYWVKKRIAEDDLSDVMALCIDDTSFRRGQSYVTVVIDAAQRRVIDVEEGRSAQQVWDFSEKLEKKGGDCTKVTQVASDMSSAYISGIHDCFPNAQVVIDRFHVSQLMRNAMDEVRREEQGTKASRSRKSGKKLLMIPQGRMDKHQQEKLAKISKLYPKTGRAFRMVQAVDTVYKCSDIAQAITLFEQLYTWLRRSRLEPMKRVALTLRKHKTEILAYYFHRLTNAVAEGINSIIQAGKRKARGFATFRGFSTMIYLESAKLDFAPIPLFC